mgnify:CR=1 FL=1
MKKILFYSNNKNKILEIRNLFKNIPIKIFSPKDFNLNFEPNEIGESFAHNAKIKSEFGNKKVNIPCFADDSGICIEALNWKPDIYSKNFINSFKNNHDCFEYIFNKVKKSRKNKAYFKTSICMTTKKSHHIVFEGKVNGTISLKSTGGNGFGYDPIFIPEGYTKTFSEIKTKHKNRTI